MEFKVTKIAGQYILDQYGFKHLHRIFELKDEVSMLDLMQEFSDYNLKQSKALEMLDKLIEVQEYFSRAEDHYTMVLMEEIKQLIQSATELKEE